MKKKILLSVSIMLLLSNIVLAQKTVTGIVRDASGPLPGVNIVEKGTLNGVSSNVDGNFTIKVTSDNAILVVSFVGFITQEISVEGKEKLNITLKEKAQELGVVVVNALGIRVDKRTLGATVSKVKGDALGSSGETSVINSLQGKVSGVRIARSNGDPGAGSSIQIRGANTISGSTQPLIVLDGVPISNDNINGSNSASGGTSQQSRLNDINEDDIESVNILKGASAAAVWGSQAANGVVVITTKRGKNTGKINIEYKTTLSIDELAELHPLQTTYGQGQKGKYSARSSKSWGDRIADRSGEADEFYSKSAKGSFVDQNGKEWLLIKKKNSRETFTQRNIDEIIAPSFSQKHNLSISNANENGMYRFSIGHIDQNGIIKTSNYKKTNVGLSSKYKFNDKLSVTTNVRYIHTESNRIQQNSNAAGLLVGLLRNAPDFDISGYVGTYTSPSGVLGLNRQRTYRNQIGASSNPGYNNPLWTLYRQKNPTEVDRLIFSTDFDYKYNNWLSFKFRGSYDGYSDERRYFFPKNSAGGARLNGKFNLDNIDNRILNFDVIAKTRRIELKKDLGGSFILGYNFNDRNRRSVYDEGSNFLIDSELQSMSNATEVEITRNYITKRRKFRTFYTMSFDYKDQLFVNTSGAIEKASSVKGAFFYPSIDMSWIFSKNIKENDILSSGKLRLGVGQVGVEPRAHRGQTTYETPTYSDYSDPIDLQKFGGGFRYNNDLGNPNLKPEIKTEYEAGLDFKLFDNRLSLSGTYYYNKVKDVLIYVPKSPSSGADNIYDNGASLENKGLEFDFNYDFIRNKKGLTASLYGNLNNNKNKVLSIKGATSLPLTSGSISSRAIVGHAMGTLWGTKAKRKADGTFDLDANGFPQLDPEQGILGDPNPDWRGSIGLKFNYKGFFGNVLVETSQGGVFAERTRFIMRSFGTHADVGHTVTPTSTIVDRAGKQHLSGVAVRGNIHNFGGGDVLLNESYYTTIGGGFGSSVINEFAINQDASWTRLSEVTLGYTLKSKKFRKATKLSSISFMLTGRNLALWTDVVGIDPQTNQTGVGNGFGVDYFTNPASRTYLFTLKIKY